MKLISTLLISAALAKRKGYRNPALLSKIRDSAAENGLPRLLKQINEDMEKAEDKTDEPIFTPFKSVDDTVYPTHNPADFEGEDIINLSENLSNPRNVKMLDVESGEELSDDLCGFYGCSDGGSSSYFHSRLAVNGETLKGSIKFPLSVYGFGFFLTHRSSYKKSAFVADIENNPTVGFVKLWPPITGPWNWSPHTNFARTRVFVNDVECFQIENYTPAKVRDIVNSGDGETYPGLVYKCAENVQNAYTIRAYNDDRWLTFKEIEIFAPNDQTRVQR